MLKPEVDNSRLRMWLILKLTTLEGLLNMNYLKDEEIEMLKAKLKENGIK